VVRDTVRDAQLEDFVESLPQGLDTVVGERGVRISGGQRQRIAIARSLYTRPEVLIFDEGTSALDSSTEQRVMTSLEQLRGRLTVIVVAHRLSTVRNSDRVAFIEDGRLVGMATFSELFETSPSFRHMATIT
jgi:ABC-type multidrug transport system fused ATPase/permease subunit